MRLPVLPALLALAAAPNAIAQTVSAARFVNGVAITGSSLDQSAGSAFDVATGQAVAQFAYRLESTGQGRGVSALVALGDDRFLVLERNNRGVGVGATLTTPDKSGFEMDLAGATDVSAISLAGGGLPSGVTPVTKSAQVVDLDANTLAALGGHAPEKLEGLAIGPRLADGRYLLLAGSDNDYSVTQNAAGRQLDVWFDFSAPDPYAASIQCPIGKTKECVRASDGAHVKWTRAYSLLPGVLQAYAIHIDDYAPSLSATAVPEPAPLGLTLAGLVLGALAVKRRTDA